MIVGAGGFGRETLDALLAAGRGPSCFLDEGMAGSTVRGLDVVAPHAVTTGGQFVVAIADPGVRQRLATDLTARGLTPATVIHPSAVVAPETTIGPGSIVLAGAYVSSGITIGAHVHVNYNATIGHDAVLGDFVTVYPGANVSGAVHLAEAVSVGANACILQGLRVGASSFVGAGAVVTRDVEPGCLAVGIPARSRARDGG